MSDVNADAVVDSESATLIGTDGGVAVEDDTPTTVKRISATQFIALRREVAKKGGTIDDVSAAWRKLTGSDQTDEQLRQYMHTRTGQARKSLVAKGCFSEDQIDLLLPVLKARITTRTSSSTFVDGINAMLEGLEADESDSGEITKGETVDVPDESSESSEV